MTTSHLSSLHLSPCWPEREKMNERPRKPESGWVTDGPVTLLSISLHSPPPCCCSPSPSLQNKWSKGGGEGGMVILLTHLFHQIRQNIIWSLTTSFFSLPLLSEHCCKLGSKISLYSRYDQQNLLFFCCLYVVHLFLSPMKTSLESCQLSSIKHFLIRCLFVTFLGINTCLPFSFLQSLIMFIIFNFIVSPLCIFSSQIDKVENMNGSFQITRELDTHFSIFFIPGLFFFFF